MNKVLGAKVQEIIEQFEIPEEFHHAIWEAYSAGADYGFFKAIGSRSPDVPESTPPKEMRKRVGLE